MSLLVTLNRCILSSYPILIQCISRKIFSKNLSEFILVAYLGLRLLVVGVSSGINNYWVNFRCIWKSPSLSELTPIIFNTGLTH